MKSIIISLFLVFSTFAKEAVTEKEKKQMIELLTQNEMLFENYFSYNPEAIDKEAKELLKKFAAIESKKFKADIDRGKKYLEKISKSASREDNNKNYHLTNSFLIKIMNKYDFGPKYQAYYCPMVRKKWIQNVEVKSRVHNPYDPSMPHCGGRL